MSKMKNFLIAFAWCWASAFISQLIMADKGTFAIEDLPYYFYMATIGMFVGPLFFCCRIVWTRWFPAGVSGCTDFIRCVHRFAQEGRLFQEPVDSLCLPEHHNDLCIYRVARREELNLTERNAP